MDNLLTVRQVAILLKVHPLTIRRYINEGKLKAIKVGNNVRISQTDLNSFSQVYSPRHKAFKSEETASAANQFSANDSFFRLKARGVSLDKI